MDSTIVTSENAQEFYATRLPQPVEAVKDEPPPAEEGKNEAGEKTERKPKPIQPRINELVAERNEAQQLALEEAQRAEELRRELEDAKRRLQALEAPAQQIEAKPRPDRSQFQTEDDFIEAIADWKAEQRIAKREQEEREARIAAAKAALVDNWRERMAQFKAEAEDYDTVVAASEVNLPQYVLDAIVESEIGPQVAYHLAKNAAEAKRIAGMSPTAALRELGKLEVRLARQEKAEAKEEPKAEKRPVEVSKAPPPIPKLAANTPADKDPKDMSYGEFKAWRKANGRR